ncbi:hypothetical protein FA15DRAFT_723618 [Coprinopsis marcescibilis]|uniref:G domain-containing protein n=1 Tax=Coprinopsis marcescibilis TaxID=230819 RepID=A0A5C3KIG8_COPMA|nr:hypothetical protein FA15DRAFT_723618 [Coprinopsis marcescibilis]
MPNIVLFGECGSGKSSIINLILGHHKAEISNSTRGCTFRATPYSVNVSGYSLTLWDTPGLNEGNEGTLTHIEAVANIYGLLKSLEDGVSLLVFCMRGPRIRDAAQKDWKLFREIICKKRVPVVVIITHLEWEHYSMEDWWTRNEKTFRAYEMNPTTDYHPTGVACITTIKGKLRKHGYEYQEEYDESQKKARELISQTHLRVPWRVHPVEWFRTITCGQNTHRVSGRGIHELASRWGISEAEAITLADALEGR